MMDVEDEISKSYKNEYYKLEVRIGTARLKDELWMEHVRACLEAWSGPPRKGTRPEVTMEEYVAWVSAGGGDE